MGSRVFLLTMALVTVLAGCLGSGPKVDLENPARTYVPMADAVFNTTGSWSVPLEPGIYDRLAPLVELVPSFDGTPIQIGIQRPAIPGCPTDETAAYSDACKTPVLLDAGPYFTPDSISQLSTRPPTAIWFVPQGYTVVYMAVRGTGGSGGCMEFMSLNEQKDVDAIVTDLATRPWSNGNVGLIGRSYDGTTPFMTAALGNPHLKTIVPISGVADVPELMFSNGTSEFRGPIMHSVVYWETYGLEAEPVDTVTSQACAEVAKGQLAGAYTALTGDAGLAGLDDYWSVRQFRERILENYHGSLYIVHGMQDWNVNPRMVVPWIQELQDHGLRVKAWLGQWGHAYPDRPDEHPNVRWDWAETLLRWFDHELKGIDVDTGPVIEVEDHRHQWWVMDSYPARDLDWLALHLNGDGTMTSEPGSTGTGVLTSVAGETLEVLGVDDGTLSLTSEPLAGPARISGLVQLPIRVTPTTATGGNVYAKLYDVYPDGRQVWIGHAWMNLRYHEGTTAAQTLVPGMPVTARLQFEPLEAYLGDGHRVRLALSQDASFLEQWYGATNADVLPHPDAGPILVHFEQQSQLRLPLLHDFVASSYA